MMEIPLMFGMIHSCMLTMCLWSLNLHPVWRAWT